MRVKVEMWFPRDWPIWWTWREKLLPEVSRTERGSWPAQTRVSWLWWAVTVFWRSS